MKKIIRKNNIVTKEAMDRSIDLVLNEVADALNNSYGPYGANTIVDFYDEAGDTITKDGHSILKNILYDEPVESNILRRLRDITRLVIGDSGDGSTSSVLITRSIWNHFKDLDWFVNLPSRRKTVLLQEVCDILINAIEEKKIEINSTEDLYDVANISLNGDTEMADLIVEAYDEVGLEGYIDRMLSTNDETYIKRSKGFEMPYGYLDEKLVHTDFNTVDLKDSKVLMFDKRITSEEYIQVIKVMLFAVVKPEVALDKLTIIAPGFGVGVQKALQANITHARDSQQIGKFNFVQIPNTKERERLLFTDLATMLDATPIFISSNEEVLNDKGEVKFDMIMKEKLGQAGQIISTYESTKFIDPIGIDSDNTKDRIKHAERVLENLKKDSDTSNVKKFEAMKRVSLLKGTHCTIYVGGTTKQEKDNKMHLVEDALLSCKSAIKYGYNQAANLTPIIAINEAMRNNWLGLTDEHYEILRVLLSAYSECHEQIFINAGFTEEKIDKVVTEEMTTGKAYDISESGKRVICPTHTDTGVLRAIISILTLLLNTNQYILPNTRYKEIYTID